jgi:hypothetical protein
MQETLNPACQPAVLFSKVRPMHNSHFSKNSLKINIFKIRIMKRPIAEYLDFEEFAGRSDAVDTSTRGRSDNRPKIQKKGIMHRS